MFDFLNLRYDAFGLDISDRSLKIVKLAPKGKFFQLASFGNIEVQPDIIEAGDIKNQDALAKTLKGGLDKIKGKRLGTRNVIASLPEQRAFLQVIQMPKMDERELRSAVHFEAENHIPLPIDEVYLDFQVISPVQNHLEHLDVLIAGCPRTTIDAYMSVLKKAGLVPLALEIESQAITRALIKGNVSNSPILLIDFGQTSTGFAVFAGYSLHFTASIPISSQQLTDAIAQKLDVSQKEAEKLKMRFGFQESAENPQSQKVSEAMEPILINLADQIRKYLSYYQTHSSHEHLPPQTKGVTKVLLCGGGANLKRFPDFLSNSLQLPVEQGNPWVNILQSPAKGATQLPLAESLGYATALGLALRSAALKEI